MAGLWAIFITEYSTKQFQILLICITIIFIGLLLTLLIYLLLWSYFVHFKKPFYKKCIKNKLFLSFIVLNFLLSCASFDEAGKVLKNEKIKTTDEFLVKKRDPLILPPDFKDVPTPGSKEFKKFDEEEKLKKS